jgi:hypothetical protein
MVWSERRRTATSATRRLRQSLHPALPYGTCVLDVAVVVRHEPELMLQRGSRCQNFLMVGYVGGRRWLDDVD